MILKVLFLMYSQFEGTGLPVYLVNSDNQKNEGLFREKNCTEIKK